MSALRSCSMLIVTLVCPVCVDGLLPSSQLVMLLCITTCHSKLQLKIGGDCTAFTKADVADMLPPAEETDSIQSWPGLFWLPPVDDEPGERNLLHLDDELAGLLEAADTPIDQARTHIMKPEPVVSVAGEDSLPHSRLLLLGPAAISADLPCAHLAHSYIAKCCCCSV